jgi:hypothetical protein
MVAGLGPATGTADLLVGLDHGDDAAVVRLDPHTGLVARWDTASLCAYRERERPGVCDAA